MSSSYIKMKILKAIFVLVELKDFLEINYLSSHFANNFANHLNFVNNDLLHCFYIIRERTGSRDWSTLHETTGDFRRLFKTAEDN